MTLGDPQQRSLHFVTTYLYIATYVDALDTTARQNNSLDMTFDSLHSCVECVQDACHRQNAPPPDLHPPVRFFLTTNGPRSATVRYPVKWLRCIPTAPPAFQPPSPLAIICAGKVHEFVLYSFLVSNTNTRPLLHPL